MKRSPIHYIILASALVAIFCIGSARTAFAAITNPQAWSLVYGGAAYPGTYTYLVPAVKNRVLVVAVSSTRSAAGTQTAAVTYGGRPLTLAVGDASASARQHSYLFYLNEAGMRAASTTDLVVTIGGGTPTYNQVYAAVYAGVNQTTPITNSRNYNSGSGVGTANFTVGPFTAPALTIASNDLALEIVNITSSTTNVTRTITSWAATWAAAIGPNAPATNINRPSAYIATNVMAGTTTSGHTADDNCWDSMSAMTLNSQVPPAFTSIHHTEVEIGQNLTFTVTADGSPTPTLSMAGTLPDGMTFTTATGILSGAPDPGTEGTYALTFTAANGVSPDATQNFTLTVAPRFPIGWHYRKCHVIDQAPGAGTGYQVRITAHYGDDLGGTNDSGENVYLNSHCRTDFSDVRFVASDGVTELNYWIETGSLTPSTSAIFWVKVNGDLSAANQTIYIYYGNTTGTVPTTSSGDNTFSFFDDFDDTLSKWVIEKTIDGSSITIDAANSYVRCGGGITSGTYGHTSLGSSSAYSGFQDGAIEVRLKESDNALAEIAYRGNFGANTGYKGRYDCRTGMESPHLRPPYYGWGLFGTAVTRFGIHPDIWYRGTLTVNTSGGLSYHQIFRDGGSPMSSVTDATTYAGPGEIALQNHYGSYSDYDWVAVRKYVNPEPAHAASWCTEESLAANVYATKSVALFNDKNGDGAISPDDTMRYNVKIYNTGNVVALGAVLTDPIPANTTYTGAWTATNGTVTYIPGSPGQISWTGDATADPTKVLRTIITFDVAINLGTPLLTVVSNQGTVSYDSGNNGTNDPAADILTDGDPFDPNIPPQTTNFTVGGSAQATGIKTVALAPVTGDADGNGVISPGDTLEYTIVITNMTGFVPRAAIEFTDVIPAHTTYDATFTPTVTNYVVTNIPGISPIPPYSDHTPVPIYTAPTLTITGIDIGPVSDPPHNVVEIKFRVILDKPMAPGVTQISNQGVGFYDSNSDGVNDTHQTTDGDPGTIGNQPTLANLYVGTISGTVFDDLNGNHALDSGEPGLSGVMVEILLYGTITDSNGYYAFTGTWLTPGNYHVVETDPTYYVSTTPNDVPVTLGTPTPPTPSTGDSVTNVNFGDQPAGNADLSVTKTCATIVDDGTNQLTHIITVTNTGPDSASNVVLTDNLTALASAGLSNIGYIEDAGVWTPWPVSNTLSWSSLALNESHIIRIFATIPPAFSPGENIATVTSNTFDPDTGNNASSCTKALTAGTRGAIKFENPACTSCSSTCSPGNFHVSVPDRNINNSLDLTTSGTIEAWIQATSCTASEADAGIVFNGTAASSINSYGFGLAGGTLFDNSPIEGSPQNIGFRVGNTVLVADTYTLTPGKWYHVACTWNASGMNIYINGILEKSNTTAAVAATNDDDLMIGQQTIVTTPTNGQYFGVVEEFRLWNTARPQVDIQNDMCRTLTLPTLPASDLVCYLKYDEASGTVAVDASGNGNDGDTTHASRVCSGAPVGDAAATPDYTGAAPADYSASFTSTLGETVTVTGDGGIWDDNPATSPPYKSGLQLYRVNDAPEPANGPMGSNLFGSRGYFGVFVTGGDAPTYSVTYTYNDAGIGDEAGLDLMYRHEGCAPWSHLDITLPNRNAGANTLTQPLMSGTEFILGKNVEPRNAIQYDGTGYVSVPDDTITNTLDLSGTGTLEAWIYPEAFTAGAGIIFKDTASVCYGFGFAGGAVFDTAVPGATAQNIGFVVGDSLGSPPDYLLTSNTTLQTDTWYHIACVWDTGALTDNLIIYINGVKDVALTIPLMNPATTGNGDLRVGMQSVTNVYFQGQIDEVRIWNTARTQTDIRGTMCRKLSGSETGLVGYWRFDEETDNTVCPDYSSNTNDGGMVAFGSNAGNDIRNARTCSSAPIGDESAYNYYVFPGPVSAQLTHGDGDYMVAAENDTLGFPWNLKFSGVQIYLVNEAPIYPPDLWVEDLPDHPVPPYGYVSPNGLTPPAGWSSIDYYRYWGVFVTDWDGLNNKPVYDVVYHYTGNPSVPTDDSVVALARRPDYCFDTWTEPSLPLVETLDTGADTLTIAGDSQYGTPATNPEYVLGGKDAPLAIVLANFKAEIAGGCVHIMWETATEIDTAGFYLWRSDQKDGGYTRIEGSFTRSEALVETKGAAYEYVDCDADVNAGKYYYKLEEVDMDNAKDNPLYGPIGPVTQTVSASQTASNSSKSDKGCFISVLAW